MGTLFEQEFVKPGKFSVGGDQFTTLTSNDVRDYVKNTVSLLKAGNKIPVYFEHPDSADPAALPVSKAEEITRNGAGWLVDAKVNKDGGAVHVLEITDADAVKKLKDKTIKFTSPEFRRKEWQDGDGNKFDKFISHVALTPKPRNKRQGEIEEVPALQFSLGDYVEQFANDEDDYEEKSPENSEPSNPDLGIASAADQQLDALVQLLKELGIDLPADTTPESLIRDLLTAVKTVKMTTEKMNSKNNKNEGNGNADLIEKPIEDKGSMQFSLADVASDKFENKLLAKVIHRNHRELDDRLKAMVRSNKITPACAEALLGDNAAIQFSADGDELPKFTVSEMIEILDRTLANGATLDVRQFSAVTEEADIKENYRPAASNGEMSDEEAAELVTQQIKADPGRYVVK
jgi:hypothetical protein